MNLFDNDSILRKKMSLKERYAKIASKNFQILSLIVKNFLNFFNITYIFNWFTPHF